MRPSPSRRSSVAYACWPRRWCDNRAMELGLRERACVITGASRGIGLATARMLVGEGAWVLLVGRSKDALTRAAAECGPDRTATLGLDVTAPDAGERLLGACLDAFGRIDALVNNAGTSALRPLEQLTDEEW